MRACAEAPFFLVAMVHHKMPYCFSTEDNFRVGIRQECLLVGEILIDIESGLKSNYPISYVRISGSVESISGPASHSAVPP